MQYRLEWMRRHVRGLARARKTPIRRTGILNEVNPSIRGFARSSLGMTRVGALSQVGLTALRDIACWGGRKYAWSAAVAGAIEETRTVYQDLGTCTLKSAETVSMGMIVGPEPDWAERLVSLLRHKGDPWNWQNAEMLTLDCGIVACFCVLHRNGSPFANVMTVTHKGVGIFGHVYTKPEDRRKGAAALLVEEVITDFRARNGRALFLGTGFNGPPFHLYRRFGFEGVEPGSGCMAWHNGTKEEFETRYFAPASTTIKPVAWRHWPASCPLFIGAYPGAVRCAPLRLFGRMSAEGPLLPVVRGEESRRQTGEPPRSFVLESQTTDAVVGLAAWDWHPLWPHICLVDVFCHPDFWQEAPALLASLSLPDADRHIAYADPECSAKAEVLRTGGFRHTATLPERLPVDRIKTRFTDVLVFEKR